MRIRRQLALVMAMALLAVTVGAVAAGAGVERYQFEKSTYQLDLEIGTTHYYHEYTVELTNPCTGEYEYTGAYLGNTLPGAVQFTETVSNWVDDGTSISFQSDYDINNYWFTFVGTVDGVDTWTGSAWSSTGQVFIDMLTLTRTLDWRSDYNHGEYVAENVEQYGNPEVAQSCIGMPMVSNRDK